MGWEGKIINDKSTDGGIPLCVFFAGEGRILFRGGRARRGNIYVSENMNEIVHFLEILLG